MKLSVPASNLMLKLISKALLLAALPAQAETCPDQHRLHSLKIEFFVIFKLRSYYDHLIILLVLTILRAQKLTSEIKYILNYKTLLVL